MKCQFFADVRDLFKWDVVEQMITDPELNISLLSLVLMLTKNGGGGGGERDFIRAREQQWPGSHNKNLVETLELFKDDPEKRKDRCIRHIELYFADVLGGRIRPWIHEQDRCGGDHDNWKPFDGEGREAYFNKVKVEPLQRALAFFDPDTGLEPKHIKKGTDHRYLRYEEIRSAYERMAENAVLMIYQHGRVSKNGPIDRRENRLDKEKSEKTRSYFRNRGRSLSGSLQPKTKIQLISDWEICFFLFANSPDLSDRLSKALQRYHARYEKTTFMEDVES